VRQATISHLERHDSKRFDPRVWEKFVRAFGVNTASVIEHEEE
jgi:HD-GYP domain-containing protein (c-di-GMP phosphodiesterase class II)